MQESLMAYFVLRVLGLVGSLFFMMLGVIVYGWMLVKLFFFGILVVFAFVWLENHLKRHHAKKLLEYDI